MKGLPSCKSGRFAGKRFNAFSSLAAWLAGGVSFVALRPAGAGLACALLLAAPLPANSFEIFGWKFFESAEDEANAVPDPLPYEADLTISNGADDLTKELKDASLLVQQQEKPPSGEAGLLARSLSDRERLIAQLYADGRYGGTVDITLAGIPLETALEQSDLPDARPVKVEILVNPGPVFTFSNIDVSSQDGDLSTDPSFWGLAKGEVAASGKILTAEKRMIAVLRDRGYPKARIAERRITADHSTNTLAVVLIADAGHQARFGPVSVKGTEVTDPDFVVQQAMLPVGGVYSPEDLARARKRLNELGIFSSIRLVEGEIEGPDGTMPVTIEVSERKRHVIGAGASWSSTEGFGVESYWRRRNLFRPGRIALC